MEDPADLEGRRASMKRLARAAGRANAPLPVSEPVWKDRASWRCC